MGSDPGLFFLGLIGKSEQPGKMLHTVPEEIDRAVALLKLSSCGVSIDDLTPAQRKYLFG